MNFQLLSYGGGVQSVTMAMLVANGKLDKPDAIIMADTGREKSSTWEYLERYVRPALAKIGMSVEIAPHSLSKVDLLSLGTGRILMPMYTTQAPDVMPEAQYTDQTGRKISKLPTYCSVEWKRRVVDRYLFKAYGKRSTQATTWFGFSLDEQNRMLSNPDKKAYYPLIQRFPLTRDDCKRYIIDCGLPLPQKSACWMCPHLNDQEWLEMKNSHPADFEKAVRLESELQAIDPDVWLHKTATPLSEVQFIETEDELESQCGLGLCMI